MMKHWAVLLDGKLMLRCLTKNKAQSKAFELSKLKQWNLNRIEVKELCAQS